MQNKLLTISIFALFLVGCEGEEPEQRLARLPGYDDADIRVESTSLHGTYIESSLIQESTKNSGKAQDPAIIVVVNNPRGPKISLDISDSEWKSKNGVGIFQKDTGSPYVTVGDKNADGVMDLLTYTVLTKNGEPILEVEDYGMDGQIDFKLHFTTGKMEIFKNNKWYVATERDDGKKYFLFEDKMELAEDAISDLRNEHGY